MAKYTFRLNSHDGLRDLPSKMVMVQSGLETPDHVLTRILAFNLFYRERLQTRVNLHMDSIPYIPDLVQLDYELRPKLWVECNETALQKIKRLSVKVHEAEIWLVLPSVEEAQELLEAMTKAKLRRNRYHLIGFDRSVFDEVRSLMSTKNDIFLVAASFDPPLMQFEFNGIWFEFEFTIYGF